MKINESNKLDTSADVTCRYIFIATNEALAVPGFTVLMGSADDFLSLP